MIPNPILKVLSTLTENGVRHLLMGGQACVLYGAVEFSRDIDLTIACDETSIQLFKSALEKLQASRIAVPQLSSNLLLSGHAIHFRCSLPEVKDLRLDVMSKLRGLPDFEVMYNRRTEIELPNKQLVSLLSLPDLVKAKKTARDKDWPVITRLVSINFLDNKSKANNEQIKFWMQELRDPNLLIEATRLFPTEAKEFKDARPLLVFAARANETELEKALYEEEQIERKKDKTYWEPLKKELETLRHKERQSGRE